MKTINLFELVGQTVESIKLPKDNDLSTDYFYPSPADGIQIKTNKCHVMIAHDQDCCETVAIEQVVGDPQALVGKTLTRVEDDSPMDGPREIKDEYGSSHTWTRIVLEAGDITVTFWILGESNGYYGEGVSTFIIGS